MDGRVRVVNQAAEAWLGRSRSRLLGRPLESIASHPERPVEGALLLALLREVGRRRAVVSGPVHPSMARPARALPWWVEGRLEGAVLLLPAVVQADPAAIDLAALAAGLAHEVRNPLTALRGAAELMSLAPAVAADTESSACVALILRESSRIDALLGRMMQLCRPLTLQRAPLAPSALLHELAARARAVVAGRTAIEVRESYDPALPPIHVDREVLLAALSNLVRNGVEAMSGHGGVLSLGVGLDPALRRLRTGAGSQPLLRFVIRDDGSGLGAMRGRLFTPFCTTKGSGTGLGLLLARQAAEAHGGRLEVADRSDGRGVEAELLLPLGGADGLD